MALLVRKAYDNGKEMPGKHSRVFFCLSKFFPPDEVLHQVHSLLHHLRIVKDRVGKDQVHLLLPHLLGVVGEQGEHLPPVLLLLEQPLLVEVADQVFS